jgi:two-component system sensor histidine kinase AlgZ
MSAPASDLDEPAPTGPASVQPASAFAPTGFGGIGAPPPASGWKEGLLHGSRVFDVCHVGVALRLIFAMYAVLGLAATYGATGPLDWLMRVAWSSVLAFPALLLGLAAACAGKVWLARQSAPVQWAGAIGIGALSALACGGGVRWAMGDLYAGPTLLSLGLTGALCAAAVYQWLLWRARLAQPATDAARLQELQSRIRPHFLFNTLNTAIALVRLDPARAEAVLEDLAELFRVALKEDRSVVTLGQEIELARRYLDIEQIRFGQRLRVDWVLDPAADAARVPPLLLQPLVENAVKHGVESAPGGGWIRVRTAVRGAQAVVSVYNSVPQEAAGPSAGHGMALRNVRERLFLLHDVAAQFEVRRDASSYRVRLVLPLPA